MMVSTFLARNCFLRSHERLLGRPTLAVCRELKDSQWLSPAEIGTLQRRKLIDLLCHAEAHSAFYRSRLGSVMASPRLEAGDPLNLLPGIPLLTKQEIRASIDDLIWRDAPGGLIASSTGGSTGEPLQFYVDRRRQACDLAARLRSHEWFGVRPGDQEVFLWGSPIENRRSTRFRRLRDRLFNQRLLDAFDMSPVRMDRYLSELESFRPAALFGYPSSLALLADHARLRQRTLPLDGLRVVFVTGEVCDEPTRQRIQSYFQAPVANGYGSREAGFIAHECPQGALHVTAEQVIVEVVDERGSPLPAGETGELVVTHLESQAMPLIRYRTGDRGRRRAGRCRCGRGLPMLDVVEGRATDFLYLPDGTIRHALSLIYPLRERPEIKQFRVLQHDDYSVAVEVVADGAAQQTMREVITRDVRSVLACAVPIRVTFSDRIQPSPSGKYRYVESRVRKTPAAVD